MKKFWVALLAAILMVSMCAVASATIYYVTGDNVRVRTGPGSDYDVIAHLSRGTKLEVESISGGWAYMHLASGSDDAYISSKYISRTKPGSGSSSGSSSSSSSGKFDINRGFDGFRQVNYTAYVNPTNSFAYLRWAPSTDAKVRDKYFEGQEVRVIAENNTWAQVFDEENDVVGFMLKKLLLK